MAIALHNVGEHRLAVRFFEQAIGPAEEETDPFIMADMLHKLGSSYNQMGLMDYAAVPLRAALKIYEDTPEDPRVPGILLALGNSLRKSSPGEAEALYKKAAELRVARLQLRVRVPGVDESWSPLLRAGPSCRVVGVLRAGSACARAVAGHAAGSYRIGSEQYGELLSAHGQLRRGAWGSRPCAETSFRRRMAPHFPVSMAQKG